MNMRNLAAFAALAMAMSACGSVQDASSGNFQRVIDAHYSRKCILVRPDNGFVVDHGRFPVTVEINPSDGPVARELNARAVREFDALVAVGLLRVEDTTVASRWHVGPKPQIPAKRYHLTPTGEKSYQAQGENQSAGFCAGHYQVDAIKRFSEPGAMGSYTISEVAYVYSPQDVPGWAIDARVREAMPALVRVLQAKRDGKATLIKTNEGWVHEQDFND